MIRVTTVYASSAGAAAEYYTGYLTGETSEPPGRWTGTQAAAFGLSGTVTPDALEALLSGHDPTTGDRLGRELLDRIDRHGNVTRAVAGYDATFSAPKSVSVLWALTGEEGFAECHDRAVAATVELIEKYGSSTRIRSNGTRLHPDTGGLTAALFRQSTSRADDPQLHTHAVISAKVQTPDGRWYALDARMLKRHQQAFGYFYQSVLRAELTARYKVAFEPIVNGQAEIAGVPIELLHRFSKRAHEIAVEMDDRIADFIEREQREPTAGEYSAMEREAAADTRNKKTNLTVPDLRTRWLEEAAQLGIDQPALVSSVYRAARDAPKATPSLTAADVVEQLAERHSTWNRMDVLRTICGTATAQPGRDGTSWATMLDQAVDAVLGECINLDAQDDTTPPRRSDRRSRYIEPVANQATSEHILAQEERILTAAIAGQPVQPNPSTSVAEHDLDAEQHHAASAVAGNDGVVLIVGPAGAGKTRTLRAATNDLHARRRHVLGLAPTAKAARVLEDSTGMTATTVAKLLYDLDQPNLTEPPWATRPGTTIVIDEAGMINTVDLYRLVVHAEQHHWRLALIGDTEQLQAVGRGGMFAELCHRGTPIELERLHRFTHQWEANASLQLRHRNPNALDTYAAHGRIRPGTLDQHLGTITAEWTQAHLAGETIAITTTLNEHVNAINERIQRSRIDSHELDPATAIAIAHGVVMVGDTVATRRNNRHLRTTTGEPVRNRERWTVTHATQRGDITITRQHGHGTITLPADYTRQHVQLAYATTEHGAQGDTTDRSINLATEAAAGRGLYVGMTRGRDHNTALVVTGTDDLSEAMKMLDSAIAFDRADVPSVAVRRAMRESARTRRALRPSHGQVVGIRDDVDAYRALLQQRPLGPEVGR